MIVLIFSWKWSCNIGTVCYLLTFCKRVKQRGMRISSKLIIRPEGKDLSKLCAHFHMAWLWKWMWLNYIIFRLYPSGPLIAFSIWQLFLCCLKVSPVICTCLKNGEAAVTSFLTFKSFLKLCLFSLVFQILLS